MVVAGMLNRISVAARYGSVKNGPRIVNRTTKSQMRRILAEIESGRFARSLAGLTPSEVRNLGKATARLSNPQIREGRAQVRAIANHRCGRAHRPGSDLIDFATSSSNTFVSMSDSRLI